MAKRLKAKDYIKAIEGSGGNISEIARILGCHRDTVSSAIKRLKSVAEAIEKEKESLIDEAQFGIHHNIKVRNEEARKTGEPINATDHKWLLTRLQPQEFGDKLDITSGDKPFVGIEGDLLVRYLESLEEFRFVVGRDSKIHSSEQNSE